MNILTSMVLNALLLFAGISHATENVNHLSQRTEDVHEERHLELPIKTDDMICV